MALVGSKIAVVGAGKFDRPGEQVPRTDHTSQDQVA